MQVCIYAAPSVSAIPRTSTRFLLLEDFGNDVPEDYLAAGSGSFIRRWSRVIDTGRMRRFQFWANLPSALEMIPPRYQEEVKSVDIREITDDHGHSCFRGKLEILQRVQPDCHEHTTRASPSIRGFGKRYVSKEDGKPGI